MAGPPDSPGKYARPERERRFLAAAVPGDPAPVRVARITDRYLKGTRLRLRTAVEETPAGTTAVYKLTQKIPAPDGTPGLITTLYLSPGEHAVFDRLAGDVLRKTRYSIPPFGVDVFEPPLHGLVMAEIEFDTDPAMRAFPPPEWAVAEVTADPRFTGGRFVGVRRDQIVAWVREYGIDL